MTELTRLTIAQTREKLAGREFTAVELADAYLAAIDAANGALNAYVTVTAEKARAMAAASDERLAKGQGGALEGIPLGIKDLFGTEGVHTQACSHVLDGFEPRYESTVTANLWADGAVMLGKLNMDEFAMGSSNETSYYGPVVNPWRRSREMIVAGMPVTHGGEGGFAGAGSGVRTERVFDNVDLVPGGSSGGSAAAVSAWLCAGATATDTGGSIRQPAALTGTVGIKPTYGRCSRWGIVAFASSLDQAGPIARDVRDAAILLKSMASVDPKDTTSVDLPVPDYEASLGRSIRGMKIGIRANTASTACRARSRRCGSRASTGCATPAPRSSTSRCRTRNTPCRPITSSRPPRPRPTSPATTASATACGSPGRTSSRCTRRPVQRASAARSSGAS
jgi:aspartyl-tRNA(Asn)/glutamyl-tRNA(Gln) amidotransferase subunit A